VIPLVDLKAQYAALKPEIDAAVQRVLDSAAFILGREVEEFEHAFAAHCGAQHAIGVASGTGALHLALLACGVEPGHEVITTPHTFIATAEAISHTGARPVFVDIDPATYNLDPALVEAAVGPRTRAIVPVHLYGRPADMDGLLDVAGRHGLRVIEDAAQAHGARYKGRRVGTWGDVGCFSFYPGKNLGAYGDGGLVTTNDAQIADRIRMLRDHGRKDKYAHQVFGYGERLDALQAAVLQVKLRHLDEWNNARRRAAHRYRSLLDGSPVVLPADPGDAESVYHLFVIRVPDRDRVLRDLKLGGIGAGVHYPIPLHLQEACAHLGYRPGSFPYAEAVANEVLSLPLYPEVSQSQQEEVAAVVRTSVGKPRAGSHTGSPFSHARGSG
jgi:dTDP-4-amino-4,6-dideoxygalactose transaminase